MVSVQGEAAPGLADHLGHALSFDAKPPRHACLGPGWYCRGADVQCQGEGPPADCCVDRLRPASIRRRVEDPSEDLRQRLRHAFPFLLAHVCRDLGQFTIAGRCHRIPVEVGPRCFVVHLGQGYMVTVELQVLRLQTQPFTLRLGTPDRSRALNPASLSATRASNA